MQVTIISNVACRDRKSVPVIFSWFCNVCVSMSWWLLHVLACWRWYGSSYNVSSLKLNKCAFFLLLFQFHCHSIVPYTSSVTSTNHNISRYVHLFSIKQIHLRPHFKCIRSKAFIHFCQNVDYQLDTLMCVKVLVKFCNNIHIVDTIMCA